MTAATSSASYSPAAAAAAAASKERGSYVAPLLIESGAGTAIAVSAVERKWSRTKKGIAEIYKKHEQGGISIMTIIVGIVSGTAVLTALLAMYIEASMIACLAFTFPLVTAPYAIHQRRQLNKSPNLRMILNAMRLHVNRLAKENNILMEQNNRLAVEVSKLHHVEDEFQQLTRDADCSTNKLHALIEENSHIQHKLKQLQQAKELQSVLQIIFSSDRDHDGELSPFELEMLASRLQVFDRFMDQDKLKRALSKRSSATDIYSSLSSNMYESEEYFGFTMDYARWLD